MERIVLASGTSAVLARPDGENPVAFGLVVIPDIWGMRPLFDDLVQRLSTEQGWPVVAVDPFPGRSFPGGDMQARFQVMPEMDDARLLADLVDAAARLGATTVGCLGFCMGGMYTLKAASTGAFHRLCAFYGQVRVPASWQGPGHGDPLAMLAQAPAATETMAVIGGKDAMITPEDVAALRVAGVEVVFYPDAEHGFAHDPDRPSHRPEDAADAWAKALAFLAS